MKVSIPFLLIIVCLFACNSPAKAPETSNAKIDPQVALDFMNSYVQSCNELKDSEKWVAENELLSEEFKSEYQKLMKEAWEADPELGLGFDPIFDAQDYSEKGYQIKSFDSKTGMVNLEGVDYHHVKVRVKMIGDKCLVDGAGIIRTVEK